MPRTAPLALALLLAAPAAPAAAQTCEPLPLATFGGTPADIALEGSLAYVANGLGGLLILDVSMPTPAIVSVTRTPGNDAAAIDLEGDFAYFAEGFAGASILDVSNPDAPHQVATFATGGAAGDIDVVDDVAFVTLFFGGFEAYDVTNPGAPTLLDSIDTAGSTMEVEIVDDLAYICGGAGLTIVDVSDPSNMTILSQTAIPGDAYSLDVAANFVYLVDDAFGLRIFDATDPAAPQLLGSFAVQEPYSYDVTVAGSLAFLSTDQPSGDSTLELIDVSSPTEPVGLATLPLPDGARITRVDADTAYVACTEGGVQVIDAADPAQPLVIGSLNTPNNPDDIEVSAGVSFIADYDDGIHVVDLSAAQPDVLATIDVDHPLALARQDDVLYVGLDNDLLLTFDISDPSSPSQLGSIEFDGAILDVEPAGPIAYVVSDDNRLHAIDVADPTNPTELDAVFVPDAQAVALAGDVALVAIYDGALAVLDIQSPDALQLLDTIDVDGDPLDIDVEGNLACIGTEQDGYLLFDVSDPTRPSIITADEDFGNVVQLDLAPALLLIAGDSEVNLIDLSDPATPQVITTIPINDSFVNGGDVALDSGVAFIASRYAGLERYEVSACLPCPADLNADGELNILDFVTFQQLWQAADPAADCDANGAFDVIDFVCYQSLFTSGCTG